MKNYVGSRRVVAIALISSIILAVSSSAQNAASSTSSTPSANGDEWRFGFAPYLWMVNVDGTLGLPRPGEIPIEVPFSTLKDSLNWGVAGVFMAEKGKYGALLDASYVSLSGEGPLPTAISNGISFDNDLFYSNALFTYNLDLDKPAEVKIGGGARIWHVGVDARFTLNGNLVRTQNLDETWVDAVIGVRAIIPFNNRWYGDLAGDIGTGQSDFTGSAHAGLGFKITEKIHLYASYRFMYVDYSNDGFVYDIKQHGALLGAIFIF